MFIIVKITIDRIAITLISKRLRTKKNPRYSEKAIATAAIEAVLITATAVQP